MAETNKDQTSFRKPYQELVFTDNFMFHKVLKHNSGLCKDLIELLLNLKVERIAYKDQDHEIAATSDSKSVRLDVYLDDGSTRFDLEMQNLRKASMPRRTRFYQTMIDVEALQAGMDYGSLPDSYIIFICMFDPYRKGLYKYEFRELCLQDHTIEMGSGTSKVFINAMSRSEDMSDEMRAFFDYLGGGEARSSLTKKIESGVAHAKAFKPWEAEYMQMNELMSDARKEGREEARFEDVDRITADGHYTAERACEILGVSVDNYRAYLEDRGKEQE